MPVNWNHQLVRKLDDEHVEAFFDSIKDHFPREKIIKALVMSCVVEESYQFTSKYGEPQLKDVGLSHPLFIGEGVELTELQRQFTEDRTMWWATMAAKWFAHDANKWNNNHRVLREGGE